MKVLLGLSGGVDSAVAAIILQKQGYEVIGAFMRCFSEEKNKLTGECPWIEDKREAQKIASKLKIKFIELNYEKDYRSLVILPMFKAYAKGLTPNPDANCNTIIKFPFLCRVAKKLGCQYIATGHYTKKIEKDNKFYIQIPKDKSKDQTYFLYGLNQKDLKHTLFPIGDYTKSQVRSIAKSNHLDNWDRPSTKGLCFIGNIDVKEFLKQKIKNKSGKILNPEGQIVGTHKGIQFFTIGERIGNNDNIQIINEYRNETKSKLYVSNKDKKNNILVVAPENHKSLFKNQFEIKKINWISGKPIFPLNNVKIRIRHLGQLISAKIVKKGSRITAHLMDPTQGIAEGQSCVIYVPQGIMLGGGEIAY
ncbi:MAG: tRNA 2-thiouridine(34) synthase MnmA [Candidatus Pacearchaeota archaeon]